MIKTQSPLWSSRNLLTLGAIFLLALFPRLYSAQTVGWHWDSPGSFTLVNFDEGGSCRAALDGFTYSGFIGRQTIAIASALGHAPPPDVAGNPSAVKAYCHGPGHILVARSYSAVAGALTAVLTGVLTMLLLPGRPAVAWTAGALLALSGFHISESHSATVDAPSVFFIYLFLTLLVFAVKRGGAAPVVFTLPFAVFALWAKYWVFAVSAYLACLPLRWWRYITSGIETQRFVMMVVGLALLAGLMSNLEFRQPVYYPLLALWYLLVPWRRVPRPMRLVWLLLPVLLFLLCQIDIVERYTMSSANSRFGIGYAAIGWHKWPRNLLNLPLLLMVGLGLPALAFLPNGIRALCREKGKPRAWWCLVPLLLFLLFMAFVSPITYYRHYLPLLPVAAILASWGFCESAIGRSSLARLVFLLWPALLAVDLVDDYHRDPRIELRDWYAQHPAARVFYSYYVNPPRGRNLLFTPDYAQGRDARLHLGDYLILSENWYDTAFANELNGPLVHRPERMIKTTPRYTAFYREVLSGNHPQLQHALTLPVRDFMPELVLHRRLYGTFQLFVGDIQIYRIVH